MQLRFDYRIDIVTIVCRLDEEIKNEDKIRKNTEFLHKTRFNFIFNHKKKYFIHDNRSPTKTF